MLDLVGVIASVAGLIATLRSEFRREKKLIIVRDILIKQRDLFALMARVKDVHDHFEAFCQSTAVAFSELSERDITDSVIESKLSFVMSQEKRINIRVLPDRLHLSENVSSLPSLLQDPVSDLQFYYPNLQRTLSEYAEHIDAMKGFLRETDFGRQYKATRSEVRGITDDIVYQADKVLINMVPIVRGFHDELTTASESFDYGESIYFR